MSIKNSELIPDTTQNILINKNNSIKNNLSVCMISDFFFPKLGGVEVHIYQLSLSLIRRGIKVIVITRAYKNRQILRIMGNGLKVYYLPIKTLADETMIPTLFALFPKIREILIKENINLIHMHQVFKIYKYFSLLL